jgi:DNA recombination protein RmuC
MSIFVVVVLVGVLIAVATGLGLLLVVQRRSTHELAAELRRASAEQSQAAAGAAVDRVLTASRAVLAGERELAAHDLEAKKLLIDQQLGVMNAELSKVGQLVRELEVDRREKFGAISEQLGEQQRSVLALAQSTQSLREALSSTKMRGQWGERMAEDVLRLAGLVEGLNYQKQTSVEGGRGVPDFTFLLPNELHMHMDVKFPLDNYVRFAEARSDLDRKRFRDDFLRDVRGHVKALASRDYVDPASGTVDFVLLFIPNEQLYGFIHEQDARLGEDAAARGVVLCSPLTLFAVLALVRQTVDNFQLARTSDEILELLGTFKKQWGMFVEKMDKLDRSIETVRRDYDDLVGTRRRALERPIDKIDALRDGSLVAVEDEVPPLALEA